MPGDSRDDETAREPASALSDGAAPTELWAKPDEFADGATRWANEVLRRWSTELHPLLGQIGHEKATDIPSGADLAETDPDLATPLYRSIRVEVPTTVDLEEVLTFDVPATLARLYEMADEWGGQLVRGMLEHISDVSDEYGQTVDASGRDFFDAYIESFESLELSFDEYDEPVLPTLVMHPDTLQKLQGRSPTPEQQGRIAEIIERKRGERRASQRRPDLP